MAIDLFEEQSGSIVGTVIDIRIGVGKAGIGCAVIDDHPMSRAEIMFIRDPALRDVVLIIVGKDIHDGLRDDGVPGAGKQPDPRIGQVGRVIYLARRSKSIGSCNEGGDVRDGVGGIGVHAVVRRPPDAAVGAVIGAARNDPDTADQA